MIRDAGGVGGGIVLRGRVPARGSVGGGGRRLCRALPRHWQRRRIGAGVVGETSSPRADAEEKTTSSAKASLRQMVLNTQRGALANQRQRGEIAEAQVAVENLAPPLDYEVLAGRWRLIYTNAIDVLPLLMLGEAQQRLPFNVSPPLEVGSIYQEFSSPADGDLANIIKLGAPFLLEKEGLTIKVNVKFEIRSPQRLWLKFMSAEVRDLDISPDLEALIAPAILPRASISHQLLLSLKEFSFSFPITRPVFPSSDGGTYLLTYLDDDMLIGRALGNGGSYIFDRAISS